MKIFTFCGLIQSSIVFIFILLLSTNYSIQSIDLDQNADAIEYNSPILILGHEQDMELVRHRRASGLIEYLSDRRKKRNYTSVLAIQMKKWLNIEMTRREETEQKLVDRVWSKDKPKEAEPGEPTKPKEPDYTPNEEQPIEYETNTDETSEANSVDGSKNNKTRPIVYKKDEFIELCKDPVFEAADSNLDGTEIIIFKGQKFYVLENLKYGSGNLVASGLTTELLPNFDSNGFTSMVTIIEGAMRGYNFAFYNSPERAGWTPIGYTHAKHSNEFKKKALTTLPKKGFQAVFHNRDIIKPLMIALNGELVYYYVTDNKTFTKVKEVTHDMSEEKLPKDITAGFSMPNGYIYLFRNKQYCVRELHYEVRKKGVYCDLWLDNKIFLGCYGQYPPPYSMEDGIENYSTSESNDLCDHLKSISLEKSVDGLTIMAYNGDKYWNIHHFPEKTEIESSASSADKWKGFESNPEAIMIVQEGPHLRGSLFSFKKGKYNQWAPNGKPLEKNKKIEKFNAIIHNSDILNPMAVAFAPESVYYYNTDSTSLKLNKTLEYIQTEENWPKGITTGLTINTGRIFLFKGDTYCLREWKCSDKKTNCCKKWLSAKDLFRC